jgi:hypothetical protein
VPLVQRLVLKSLQSLLSNAIKHDIERVVRTNEDRRVGYVKVVESFALERNCSGGGFGTSLLRELGLRREEVSRGEGRGRGDGRLSSR